jgi:hypothetical protein
MHPDSDLPEANYVYRPLDVNSDNIRLLHVSRGESGAIWCDVTTVSLATQAEYVCLSYTWGPEAPVRKIGLRDNTSEQVNGEDVIEDSTSTDSTGDMSGESIRPLRASQSSASQSLSHQTMNPTVIGHLNVRENLFDFLETYCLEVHTYIWIDQISIDQSNTRERGCQVAMMAKIYTQASSVVIWLGNDDLYHQAVSDILEPGPVGDIKVAAVVDLMRDVYFTRLWVMQEIFLARNIHILVCKNIWIPWNTMTEIGHDQFDYFYEHVSYPAMGLLFHKHSSPRSSLMIEHEASIIYRLESCIRYTIDCKCQDPRDKLYGLLGLVAGQCDWIIPDYTKSVQAVFLNIIRATCLDRLRYPARKIDRMDVLMRIVGEKVGLTGLGHSSFSILRYKDTSFEHPFKFETDIGFEFLDPSDALSTCTRSVLEGRWWTERNGERQYYD